ncbi:FAD:protein FMN transferase [Aliikangiella coralliicola]|uniref:FAD:protein FMN transferase n=1 Tax=Aliikangiella coralliicola TaxID=2592383 RepID=A0A545UCE3_9GAMM|nr:FAD:protein FMN transferase [Aliikangiella coralliicola]TQV87135.1 FAD:protein FMN transferase [Aliikangiella coralliicola]
MKCYQISFHAMGGPCELRFFHHSEKSVRKVFDACRNEVLRFEKKYSRYLEDSVLSKINQHSNATKVDSETTAILNYAQTAYQISDGLFDISSGVLRTIWDFKSKLIPEQKVVNNCLKRIGWNKINWNDGEISVPKDMELDFGGIVKEYAADAVKNIALNSGITNGLINLGGDIVAIGSELTEETKLSSSISLKESNGSAFADSDYSANQGWPIGIRHPDNSDKACCRINLLHGAVATSGDYEKFFIQNGRRYCHIFNPKTGYPVSNAASVTVIAPLCIVAGTLSTLGMLLPVKDAIAFLKQSEVTFILTYREEDKLKIVRD